MTAWLARWLAMLLLGLPFVPVFAVNGDDHEIDRLVKQLSSDSFKEREAATKRLKEIGEPALEALHKAATSDDPEVRRRAEIIVVARENKLYGPELCLTGHTSQVWSISVSADGKRVLTSSADKTLRLWDADTGKELRVFEGHSKRIVGAALSPDGKHVLSGSEDNGFEHDPEEAARVRVGLLRELATTGEALVATHLSFPSVCHVAVAGDAFR